MEQQRAGEEIAVVRVLAILREDIERERQEKLVQPTEDAYRPDGEGGERAAVRLQRVVEGAADPFEALLLLGRAVLLRRHPSGTLLLRLR